MHRSEIDELLALSDVVVSGGLHGVMFPAHVDATHSLTQYEPAGAVRRIAGAIRRNHRDATAEQVRDMLLAEAMRLGGAN